MRDETHLNIAGAEVVATLLVIVFVLALVAGFLGYQLRMQMSRAAAAAKAKADLSREASSAVAGILGSPDAAATDTAEEKLIWPERQDQVRLSVIAD